MKISSDYSDLLKSLNAAGVRYLIVGGYAVMIYTEPRFTKDLDLWIDPTLANAEALVRALTDFGAPLKGITARDFTASEVFYQLGADPVRVDVLTSLPGLRFADAWRNKISIDFGGESAFVIGRDDLVRSKDAAGRNRPRARRSYAPKWKP